MYKRTGMLIALIVAIFILATSITVPVLAYTNSNLTQLLLADSDIIYNYDFTSTTYDSTHVDHPVTIIFRGQTSASNVNKTRIYNEFYTDGFDHTGSSLYNYLNDGLQSVFYWVPNTDSGGKTATLDWDAWHYRQYAANNVNMLNSAWNKYVIATTHRDYIYGGGYGWSETCENNICGFASAKTGWVVNEDTLYLYNRDWPGRWDGFEFWLCDGYASIIRIP